LFAVISAQAAQFADMVKAVLGTKAVQQRIVVPLGALV
jgi:hypothetical protein